MAATIGPNQLCLCNCNSQSRPLAKSAAPFSEAPSSSSSGSLLRGALFGAARPSAGNLIRSPKAVSSAEKLSGWPRSRHGDTNIVASVSGSSAPMLDGRRGRFSKMDGVRWVQGEVDSSRRVTMARATGSSKVAIMVDPVEAKRLAAAEMKAIQARAKLKRRTEIEAINGGWAVIGLTVGIIIDGYTGKSILLQIAGYLDAVADLLQPLTSL